MKTKNIHLLLCFSLSFCLTLQAQQSPFYYNKGKKVQLEIDYTRISVVSEGELTSEKVKSKINNSDFVVNKRLKNVLKQDPTSKEKRVDENQGKEIITSEIVFPNKMDAKAYDDFIQLIQKEQGVLKASPTYLLQDFKLGISNSFLVKIKNASDIAILETIANKYAIQVMGSDEYLPNWYTLACTKDCPFNAVEAANYFYETRKFESTEPEYIFKVTQHSVDPYFGDQWGLKNTGQYGGTPGVDINVEAAWTKTTGSPNIRVAVFDSGIEMDHPDLENVDPNLWYDVNYPNLSFHTYKYHGTTCAGIIGATKDNGIGISGVAPGTTLISISLDFENATASDIARGFGWARTHGVDVISCSWGVDLPVDSIGIVNDAIDSVFTFGRGGKGCVVVFSVGNDGENGIAYPANSESLILAVGAISPCGELKTEYSCDSMMLWGSNYGAELDVVAPGVKISTTDADHVYTYNPNLGEFQDEINSMNGFNTVGSNPFLVNGGQDNFGDYFMDMSYTKRFFGTSAACPFVAGIAALILSKDPNLTVQQVNRAIEYTATKLSTDNYEPTSGRINGDWSDYTGYGLANANSALLEACNKNFDWAILTGNTTIYGCKVVMSNVWIDDANIIIKADETTIDGIFEVLLGSTLVITNNEQ